MSELTAKQKALLVRLLNQHRAWTSPANEVEYCRCGNWNEVDSPQDWISHVLSAIEEEWTS
jgi:hypothetical protein